jgi:hypothetical protein
MNGFRLDRRRDAIRGGAFCGEPAYRRGVDILLKRQL